LNKFTTEMDKKIVLIKEKLTSWNVMLIFQNIVKKLLLMIVVNLSIVIKPLINWFAVSNLKKPQLNKSKNGILMLVLHGWML